MTAMHSDWLRPEWALDHVQAFMTTRAGGVSQGPYASMNVGRAVQDEAAAVAENRARVSRALGAPLVFMPQVHGAEVLHLQAWHAEPDAEVPKADAAISTSAQLGVAIQTADCLPVLFAAPGGVGGAHAGWRGLAAGVLENTVAALCRTTGCQPQDIQAWLGACIGPAAFEVGEDVLRAFGATPADADPALFVYRPNAQGEPRWRADLAELARRRLQAAGLSRISGGRWCTFSEDSRFFSFRREPVSGRMAAVIRLR
jgi:YfiH family protein